MNRTWSICLLAGLLSLGPTVAEEPADSTSTPAATAPTSTAASADSTAADTIQTVAREAATAPEQTARDSARAAQKEWLNSIWTDVEDMVEREELKLQETVDAAGVRGAETEDDMLSMAARRAQRFPSKGKLTRAIKVLEKSLATEPLATDAPQMRFLIGQCYEQLKMPAEAVAHYQRIVEDHPDSDRAAQAKTRLEALDAKNGP